MTAASGDCDFGACFYYAGASQYGLSATGASVDMTQAKPLVGVNDIHSLAELAVESSDAQQIVEFGWIVAREVNGDSNPHLFVYHWVNGSATCYNGCGYVSLPGTATPAGTAASINVTRQFGIAFANGKWLILYGGREIGYFPESLWGGRFKSAGIVQVFGEVAVPIGAQPQTQMGNGLLGSQPNSAVISRFALVHSASSANLAPYSIGDASLYDYGFATPTGLHFGGPG